MTFDDQLHSLSTPPPAGDPLDRVMRRVQRTKRRRAAGSIALVVMAVAAVPVVLQLTSVKAKPVQATGFTGSQRSATPATVVPWAYRLGSATSGFGGEYHGGTLGGQPPAALCNANSLSLSLATAILKDGEATSDMLFTNNGATCSIVPNGGSPEVTTEDGTAVPAVPNLSNDLMRFNVDLPHGSSASSVLSWRNWCGDSPGTWSVKVNLGGGSTTSSVGAGSAAPTCAKRSEPSLITYSAPVVLNELGQPAADPQKGLTSVLTTEPSVRIGDVLHLVLHLTNLTRGPISLTPCPSLGFSFDKSGPGSQMEASRPLLLNCPQAPAEIEVGNEVDFQLELPMSPALGDGQLAPGRWYVNAYSDQTLPVTVEPARAAKPIGQTVDCGYAAPVGEQHTITLPPETVTVAAVPKSGTISTTQGDLSVDFDASSPCAVTALLDLARQGAWDQGPAYDLQHGKFSSLSFTPKKQAQYVFPTEVTQHTTYPEGTVLFYGDADGTTGVNQLQITTADVPYPPEFVPIGRVTSGLSIIKDLTSTVGFKITGITAS